MKLMTNGIRLSVPASPARVGRAGVALGLLAATMSVSAPSEAKMFKPSAAEQKRIGAEAARQVESKYRIVGGSRQARVQRVGSRLVRALPAKDRQTWAYRFRVIDSKEVNAFALPGGPIYIYTGLLDRLDDNELAGVMSHEIAHVRKEHWANMAAESQTRNLGLGVLLGITKAGKGWYNAAGLASGLMDLKYSRKDEDQSDAAGLQNMRAAGYDPRGMLGLFQEMQQASRSSGTPEFLRSHPLTSDRINKTRQRIAQMR